MSPEQLASIRHRVGLLLQQADQIRPQIRVRIQELANLYGSPHSAESYQNILMLVGLQHNMITDLAYIGMATIVETLGVEAEEIKS